MRMAMRLMNEDGDDGEEEEEEEVLPTPLDRVPHLGGEGRRMEVKNIDLDDKDILSRSYLVVCVPGPTGIG